MAKPLVAKLTWEVASNYQKKKKKPWVEVFKKKYVRNRNFVSIPSPKAASWSSQSIFANRDIIKKKVYATDLGMVGILGSMKICGFPLNEILFQS